MGLRPPMWHCSFPTPSRWWCARPSSSSHSGTAELGQALFAARVALGHELCGLALLHHQVIRALPGDHGLDLWQFMAWRDHELLRVGTDPLVLSNRHRQLEGAIHVRALTKELERVLIDVAQGRHLLDVFIHRPEEGLVPGEAFLPCVHEIEESSRQTRGRTRRREGMTRGRSCEASRSSLYLPVCTAEWPVGRKFAAPRITGTRWAMATGTHQHLAMLRILYGACAAALDAFRAADNPVDDQLVADLEAMIERTKGEIERLGAHLAGPS